MCAENFIVYWVFFVSVVVEWVKDLSLIDLFSLEVVVDKGFMFFNDSLNWLEVVFPIFASFYSERESDLSHKTVFSRPLISLDFCSLFLKPGRPSKSSSILRSTSLLKVFTEKFLADSLI